MPKRTKVPPTGYVLDKCVRGTLAVLPDRRRRWAIAHRDGPTEYFDGPARLPWLSTGDHNHMN